MHIGHCTHICLYITQNIPTHIYLFIKLIIFCYTYTYLYVVLGTYLFCKCVPVCVCVPWIGISLLHHQFEARLSCQRAAITIAAFVNMNHNANENRFYNKRNSFVCFFISIANINENRR